MRCLTLFCAALFICASVCLAEDAPLPTPTVYVDDLANVIGAADKKMLNGILKELEAKTTAQFVVLTIDTLNGQNLESYAMDIAHGWKLGQKGKDNGVLLLVVVKDRRYRIEVGYGLESVLPDGLVGQIGREKLVPNFKKGDYGGGIRLAALAVATAIADANKVALGGLESVKAEQKRQDDDQKRESIIVLGALVGIVVLFLFVSGIVNARNEKRSSAKNSRGQRPSSLPTIVLTSAITRRSRSRDDNDDDNKSSRGSGYSHKSSSDDSDGGSFGGGGGGDFGGGGASGSW